MHIKQKPPVKQKHRNSVTIGCDLQYSELAWPQNVVHLHFEEFKVPPKKILQILKKVVTTFNSANVKRQLYALTSLPKVLMPFGTETS